MWIILPLKGLSPVKSRLASLISPDQRTGLMKAMVSDVLAAAERCPDVAGVLLVSRDPEISELAARFGADVLSHEKDEDLNSAVQAGSQFLFDKGIERALILHGDIPLTAAVDLSRLIEKGRHCDLLLQPCRHGQGTNVMLTSLPARIPFLYGPGSFQRHVEAARRAGLDIAITDTSGMALDINSADDLLTLCRHLCVRPPHRKHEPSNLSLGSGYCTTLRKS